jgi:hypothetical protein
VHFDFDLFERRLAFPIQLLSGLRETGMISLKTRVRSGVGGRSEANIGAQARQAILFCLGAILFALAIHMMATYGFNSVVKCELENHRIVDRSQSAITKFVSANACGFW